MTGPVWGLGEALRSFPALDLQIHLDPPRSTWIPQIHLDPPESAWTRESLEDPPGPGSVVLRL